MSLGFSHKNLSSEPKNKPVHTLLYTCLFFLLVKTVDKCLSWGREGNAGKVLRILMLNSHVGIKQARDLGGQASRRPPMKRNLEGSDLT